MAKNHQILTVNSLCPLALRFDLDFLLLKSIFLISLQHLLELAERAKDVVGKILWSVFSVLGNEMTLISIGMKLTGKMVDIMIYIMLLNDLKLWGKLTLDILVRDMGLLLCAQAHNVSLLDTHSDRDRLFMQRLFLLWPIFRESTNPDMRSAKVLTPDKGQTILQEMKKPCFPHDFTSCLTDSTGVPVKLEVEDPTMLGVHGDAVAPASTEFTHGLTESHMLTTLTNSLVGL